MECASTHIVDSRSLENRLLELSNSRSFFACAPLMVIRIQKMLRMIFGWGAKAIYTDQELYPSI